METATCVFATVSLYVVGHMSSDLLALVRKSESEAAKTAARWLYLVLPDLERFNLKTEVSHLTPISAQTLGVATLVGLAYAGAFTLLASAVLARRDLR
jgi:hypothetical protein